MNLEKFNCNAPNCPVNSLEQAIVDVKKNQDKFSEKLDAMLIILAEQKALTVDLNNLKKTLDEFKESIKINTEDNKNTHINLYEKINLLEQGKVDKTDSKEFKGWVWGLIIILINFLLNAFQNNFSFFTKK